MDRFMKLLFSEEGRPFFPQFEERIRELQEDSGDIGWGYSDAMAEMTEEIFERRGTGDSGSDS